MKTHDIFIEGAIIFEDSEREFLPQGQGFYSLDKFKQDFAAAADAEAINVFLDTQGGNTTAGFEMYRTLKNCGKAVTTIAYNAHSIGSIIFLSGSERLITENAGMVIHNAWFDAKMLEGYQLNQYSLMELLDESKSEDAKLLGIYTSVSGKEKESEIAGLMANETNITASKAIELGFATGIYKSASKAVALKKGFSYSYNHIKLIKSNLEMEKEQVEKLNALEKGFKALLNLFKGTMKNLVVDLADGQKVFVFTDDGEVEGKRAVMADAEGNPTETNAPAGPHPLVDGRTITVGEDGVITAVSEGLSDRLAAMEKEKEEMAAKLAMTEKEKEEMQAKLNSYEEEKKQISAQMTALKAEFDAFKKEVPGDTGKNKYNAATVISAEEYRKLPKSQQILLNALNRK